MKCVLNLMPLQCGVQMWRFSTDLFYITENIVNITDNILFSKI